MNNERIWKSKSEKSAEPGRTCSLWQPCNGSQQWQFLQMPCISSQLASKYLNESRYTCDLWMFTNLPTFPSFYLNKTSSEYEMMKAFTPFCATICVPVFCWSAYLHTCINFNPSSHGWTSFVSRMDGFFNAKRQCVCVPSFLPSTRIFCFMLLIWPNHFSTCKWILVHMFGVM